MEDRILLQISNIKKTTRDRFRNYVKRKNWKAEAALSHMLDLVEKEESEK